MGQFYSVYSPALRHPPLDPKKRALYSAIQWHSNGVFEIYEPGIEPKTEAPGGTYYTIMGNTSRMLFQCPTNTDTVAWMYESVIRTLFGYKKIVLAPKKSHDIERAIAHAKLLLPTSDHGSKKIKAVGPRD